MNVNLKTHDVAFETFSHPPRNVFCEDHTIKLCISLVEEGVKLTAAKVEQLHVNSRAPHAQC